MKISMRPVPLFKPDPAKPGYVAGPNPDPRSAWVHEGQGQAYRWWHGLPCLVQEGRVYTMQAVDLANNPDLVTTGQAIPVGLTTLENLSLCWLQLDGGTKEGIVILMAYDRRCDGLQVEQLEDGKYTLVGPGVGTNQDDFGDLTLLPEKLMPIFNPPRFYPDVVNFFKKTEHNGLLFEVTNERGETFQATAFRGDFPQFSAGNLAV